MSDQWLPPFVIVDGSGAPVGTVEDGDSVIVFNFRADRVVEISKAFEYTEFTPFDRKRFPKVRATFWLLHVLQHAVVQHMRVMIYHACRSSTWGSCSTMVTSSCPPTTWFPPRPSTA